jgi:hypothetical protein
MDDSELQRLIDTFGETEGKKIHQINIAEKIAALEAKLAENDLKISTAMKWLFAQAISERQQIQNRE